MTGWRPGFAARLVALLLAALLVQAGVTALAVQQAARQLEAEVLQGVSRGLARHIVEHWPVAQAVGVGTTGPTEPQARRAVLAMLNAVNPGVQAYVVAADGRVLEYLGEPGMVRVHRIELAPVRRFLEGAALPLPGTDPMDGARRALFSVAPFPGASGASGAADAPFLYIVLDGAARRAAAARSAPWRWSLWPAAAGLALAALGGVLALWFVTRPLHRLALRMRRLRRGEATPAALAAAGDPVAVAAAPAPARGDEIALLEQAIDDALRRLEAQAAAHRETIAAVAHDMRTPLTALHGHLEALARPQAMDAAATAGALAAALSQSDKVRRLTQQLFELATLQAAADLSARERFRLDELVADTVLKLPADGDERLAPVVLDPQAPGPIEIEGDLSLVERALTNLIDNARRHGGRTGPVVVRVGHAGATAEVVVADCGQGLPPMLRRLLDQGHPLGLSGGGVGVGVPRASGSLGGLGLAIAQRVASLHGGSLRPLPAPGGGTRLCLSLPLAR